MMLDSKMDTKEKKQFCVGAVTQIFSDKIIEILQHKLRKQDENDDKKSEQERRKKCL
jgi:hypothetical protein